MRPRKLITAVLLMSVCLSGCSSAATSAPASAGTDVAASTRAEPANAGSARSPGAASAAPGSAPDDSENDCKTEYIPHSELLDCLYYEDRDFHIYDEKSSVYSTDGVPLCGIAPHHLTAGQMIAGMYKTAAQRDDIETVVLLAPMHYDSANTLTTSMKGWSTAFGTVKNDTELTEMFVQELGAAADDEMTEFDHSASSHIPFIRKYLPDAKVACLLVSPKASGDIPRKLSELLYRISQTKSCYFAFSIDFSHYLDPPDADRHDAQTLEAVLSGNTSEIEHFTNSNVDTPYCLSTFVRLSELLGGKTVKADSGNTFTVIGNIPYSRTTFPEGVTSYFVFFSAAQ